MNVSHKYLSPCSPVLVAKQICINRKMPTGGAIPVKQKVWFFVMAFENLVSCNEV